MSSVEGQNEELIQAGHLRQFIKKTRTSRSPPRSTGRSSRGADRSYRSDYKCRTTVTKFHEDTVKVPFGVRAPVAQVPTETLNLANVFAKLST